MTTKEKIPNLNRTIKFRVVNPKTGEVIGYEFFDGKRWLYTFAGDNKTDFYGVLSDWDFFQRLQFTGLKDCNGKEIYEGDICDVRGENAVVEYSSCCFVFYSKLWKGGEVPIDYDNKTCEIIGNIFEDKGLI